MKHPIFQGRSLRSMVAEAFNGLYQAGTFIMCFSSSARMAIGNGSLFWVS
jgi:hypothetical protein